MYLLYKISLSLYEIRANTVYNCSRNVNSAGQRYYIYLQGAVASEATRRRRDRAHYGLEPVDSRRGPPHLRMLRRRARRHMFLPRRARPGAQFSHTVRCLNVKLYRKHLSNNVSSESTIRYEL
uniref:Uncharacterized protein n=1 Tax=Pararge aegeria TaxID=116150 RepID=S4PT96_9NEOP